VHLIGLAVFCRHRQQQSSSTSSLPALPKQKPPLLGKIEISILLAIQFDVSRPGRTIAWYIPACLFVIVMFAGNPEQK
jgi:hypothetical protein